MWLQNHFINVAGKSYTHLTSYLKDCKVCPLRRQYSKRLGTIEPVFGNITVNKGMNKFTLREYPVADVLLGS
nr:transposase [Colwellia sp. Bg11-28]